MGEKLIERIERLRVEVKASLPFAAEIEALMRKRSAPRSASSKPGPPFGKPNEFSATCDFSSARHRAYCLLGDVNALVSAANLQGSDDQEGRRSYMLACRLLGLQWTYVFKAVADVSNYGIEPSAEAWARFLGPTDQRIVGRVYVAASASRPDVIKIGFSKSPEKRARTLSRQHSCDIAIIHDEAGTMLHEWAIHQLLFRASVAPEWYRAADVPAWLFPVQFGGAA